MKKKCGKITFNGQNIFQHGEGQFNKLHYKTQVTSFIETAQNGT